MQKLIMRSMRIETKDHTCLAIRALHCLSTKKPFRVLIGNFDLDNKLPTHIGWIKLSKSSVKSLIAVAWIPNIALGQCVVEPQKIEGDYRARRSIQR